MIDYNKLKIAHELAEKYAHQHEWDSLIYIGVGMSRLELRYTLTIYNKGKEIESKVVGECEYTYDIDDLIARLQELTQPTPKYKVGDTIWYIDLPVNKIHCAYIIKVNDDEYVIDPLSNGTTNYFTENELYESKFALIKAQVEYWHKLWNECEDTPKWVNILNEQYTPQFEGQIKSFADSRVATHVGCENENAFEGKMEGFNSKYACSEEGQDKIRQGMKELIEGCKHESDGKYYIYSSLGHVAFETFKGAQKSMQYGGVNYKCLKCGEFYR